ncbi:metallophosphoesterase [Desulfonatronovibrio hydrogenovorans]|uniref:metallophosphoesterase n=1 Tax=Desulfonatronovibrio hydrogenovorans TaxID=53245 RepID=UPI0006915B64|nr:metallophosphoesterase [Desulfonatronovibrio hydrogenovorans]
MLSLLSKIIGPKAGQNQFRIPDGWRVYAVGDIHGQADLIKSLHRAILKDAHNNSQINKLVVYLGDYLDRGAQVRETIEELVHRPLPGFECRYLMGNHEQLLLDFLDNPLTLEMWISLGGHSTLMSYGVTAAGSGFSLERVTRIRQEFLNLMPGSHLEFIQSLQPFFRFGDYLFVHAGIRPGINLEKQKPEDLYWIRDDFLSSNLDHGFRIIHGHSTSEIIRETRYRIGIDTGACSTGVLTSAVLEKDQVRFIQT